MAANALSIVIDVDDRGAVQKLKQLDQAIGGLTGASGKATPAVGALEAQTRKMVDAHTAHVTALDKASVSVYQLRSALQQAFQGNIEGSVRSLAASLGADLEGKIALTRVAAIAAAGGIAVLVGAMAKLVVSAIEAGEANNDFALQTAIAREHVEPLREAIVIAGGSLEAFGGLL